MKRKQKKDKKKTPKYKYKLVTTTKYPSLRKTSYLKNTKYPIQKAMSKSKRYIDHVNLHTPYYVKWATTYIYVWSAKFQKYKYLTRKTYKVSLLHFTHL